MKGIKAFLIQILYEMDAFFSWSNFFYLYISDNIDPAHAQDHCRMHTDVLYKSFYHHSDKCNYDMVHRAILHSGYMHFSYICILE